MTNPYAAPNADADAPSGHVEPEHPVAGPPPEPLTIADGDELVTIYTTNDVVEAEMLQQLLLAEGIPTPAFPRMTGAQVGLGWMAMPQLIRVPASREEDARELLEKLLEEQRSTARIEDDEYEPPVPSRRHATAKTALAIFVLGPMLIGLLVSLLAVLVSFFRTSY
jgi:hypothetical protein